MNYGNIFEKLILNKLQKIFLFLNKNLVTKKLIQI